MSESTPEDRLEQQSSPTRDRAHPESPTVPLEAEGADVAEQAAGVGPDQHLADQGGDAGSRPLEADEGDAAEQAVVVEVDEDERR